jgi:uncharacterized Fe-S center protein
VLKGQHAKFAPILYLFRSALSLILSQFDPYGSILMVDNSDIRLEQILIGRCLTIHQKIVLTQLDALYLGFRNVLVLVLVELERELFVEKSHLAARSHEDRFMIVPLIDVEISWGDFDLYNVGDSISEGKLCFVVDVVFSHQQSHETKQ